MPPAYLSFHHHHHHHSQQAHWCSAHNHCCHSFVMHFHTHISYLSFPLPSSLHALPSCAVNATNTHLAVIALPCTLNTSEAPWKLSTLTCFVNISGICCIYQLIFHCYLCLRSLAQHFLVLDIIAPSHPSPPAVDCLAWLQGMSMVPCNRRHPEGSSNDMRRVLCRRSSQEDPFWQEEWAFLPCWVYLNILHGQTNICNTLGR